MEMEINVLNNKIFTKLYLTIRVRGKTIYYFLVKSKPHERTDLLITASMNTNQTKTPIVMKTCFFLRKTDETIWKSPPFLRESSLSTNPLISEQFFHDPLLIQISKTRYPPNIRGGGNYEVTSIPLQPSKNL